MLLRLYNENTNERDVRRVTQVLASGGVIIYPTDGVYAFGCAVSSVAGLEKLQALCGKSTAELTIVCSSISQVAEWVRVDNTEFKVLKRNTPGAFTFILNALSKLPDRVLGKRKTIGVRIPDSPIACAIVEALGQPLVTASVKDPDEVVEYTTDPDLIWGRYSHRVDMMVDGGAGDICPSTVVDFTTGQPEITRQGRGELK